MLYFQVSRGFLQQLRKDYNFILHHECLFYYSYSSTWHKNKHLVTHFISCYTYIFSFLTCGSFSEMSLCKCKICDEEVLHHLLKKHMKSKHSCNLTKSQYEYVRETYYRLFNKYTHSWSAWRCLGILKFLCYPQGTGPMVWTHTNYPDRGS